MKSKLIVLLLFVFTNIAWAKIETASRIIVFGDSLSDLGTYGKVANQYGGGKFTTNPGQIWIEIIAEKMQVSISPNRLDGFNNPVELLGGLNYAQGGARINNPTGNGADKGYSTRPLTTQLEYFISENQNFKNEDVVFIQGGANDVFVVLTEVVQGKKTPQDAVKELAQTASELSNLIQKVISLGAKKIVLLNLPQVEKTPQIINLDPKVQGLVAQMTTTYNQVLQSQVKSFNEVTLVDVYNYDVEFNKNYLTYGFTNITEQACDRAKLPIKSSLVCSEATLVNPTAMNTYKFADAIHPTSGYSKFIGEYIWAEMQK